MLQECFSLVLKSTLPEHTHHHSAKISELYLLDLFTLSGPCLSPDDNMDSVAQIQVLVLSVPYSVSVELHEFSFIFLFLTSFTQHFALDSIPVIPNDNLSLLPASEEFPCVQIYHTFSLLIGHLGCFHILKNIYFQSSYIRGSCHQFMDQR